MPRTREDAAMSDPAVVLVHGAWHGSWCWDAVLPLVPGAVTVDLPSAGRGGSTEDDVAEVLAAVERVGGPVLLCGHSYGGAVIGEAAAHPAVVGLVFVCAFTVVPGESLLSNAARDAAKAARARQVALAGAIRITDDGQSAVVDPDGALAAFYADCPPELAAAARDRLVPHSMAVMTRPLAGPGWQGKPSTYVLCEHDEAIQPEMQEVFAARCDTTVRLATDHSPMLSTPERLAEIINEARAAAVSSA